jgi:8-oxo-dGTP pyrophosphatase MutT (NUDIX family)
MKEEFKIFTRWIIRNKEWKFLLVEKNMTRKTAPWIAVFPWWTVEFWEKIEDALIRETKEEVWLDIISMKMICNQTLVLKWIHWIGIYFLCEVKNMDFKNMEPEKHTRVFFWDKNNLDDIWRYIIKYIY